MPAGQRGSKAGLVHLCYLFVDLLSYCLSDIYVDVTCCVKAETFWPSSVPQLLSTLRLGRLLSNTHRRQDWAHGSTVPPVCWSVPVVVAGKRSGSSTQTQSWPPQQAWWRSALSTHPPDSVSWCSVAHSPPSWAPLPGWVVYLCVFSSPEIHRARKYNQAV